MKKTLLVFLILFSQASFAVQEYYGISRSIRSLGMGGAFYSLSNDEYALFYNPAGLSLYNGDSEGMVRFNAQTSAQTPAAFKTISKAGSKISPIVDSLTQYQGTPLYGQGGIFPFYVRKNFAIGLLIADTKVDFAMLGKDIDSSVDATVISDSGLVIGYGRPLFTPNWHFGFNAKGLVRAGGRKSFTVLDIAQNQNFDLDPKSIGGAGFGIDADVGTTYEIPHLPWGLTNRASLVLSNLVGSTFPFVRTGGAPPGLERTLSLGYYTVFPGWRFVDNFHVLVDFAEFNLFSTEQDEDLGYRDGSIYKHINFGVEMPMGWFTLRTGFHQGYITAGFGLNLKFLKVDFATYGEELASTPGRLQSRRYALTIALGAGSAPEPPYIEQPQQPNGKVL